MASDRRIYNARLRVWQQLRDSGEFSVPASQGTMAIISSSDADPDAPGEPDIFHEEAEQLAARFMAIGKPTRLILGVEWEQMTEVIQDRSISDVYLVGHGTLSCFSVSEKQEYDWFRASVDTTHLKTGLWVQRTCGVIRRLFSPPAGLLVVSNHRQVYAAVGSRFEPKSLDDPVNALLKPVTNNRIMKYDDIKAAFIQHEYEDGTPLENLS